MKYFSFINFGFIAVILLLLNACSTPNPTPDTSDIPATPTPTPSTSPTENMEKDKTTSPSEKGGQVVEVGAYHLELLTLKEAGGLHLDFYLQKGDDHSPITNAIVTGKVQSPDGTQQDIDFKYSDEDKHYTANLSTEIPGDYKLAILSDINGEKVNGRFSFEF